MNRMWSLVAGAVLAGVLGGGAVSAQPAASPEAAQAAGGGQRRADALVDGALRRVLGVLMAQYGELTGKVPPRLNDADLALREAARAMQNGDDATAAAAIRKAIAALQEGGQAMQQQLVLQFGASPDQGEGEDEGEGMGGEQPGDQAGNQDGEGPGDGRQLGRRPGGRDGRGLAGRDGGERRDPLGRQLREDGNGQSAEGGVHVPEQMEQARSAAIQQELRRREAEKSRPQPELDYIDRLLRQF